MFEKLIVPVSPRLDIYPEANMRHTDDTPTVADLFPPYATAQDVKPSEVSLSMISKAWAKSTNFYLEM